MSIKTLAIVMLSSLLIAGCASQSGTRTGEKLNQTGIPDYSDPQNAEHVWWK
ncbi:hypothetical protein GLV89_02335 [Halomonas alkaliantarctica]|nr:hypothetical protein [Halomonas alkaliantarctica]